MLLLVLIGFIETEAVSPQRETVRTLSVQASLGVLDPVQRNNASTFQKSAMYESNTPSAPVLPRPMLHGTYVVHM